jgi:uncharacterized protein DUF2867
VRVLFVSDTHLGFDSPSRPRVVRRRRADDLFQNFERALEPAWTGQVDVVAHGGDLLREVALMPRVSPREFERLPLRVHQFLAGVPLHDVWAVDLPRARSGITLDEFLRAADGRPFRPSMVVRALLSIRFFVGRILGWDREPDGPVAETFATRLTTADLSQTLTPVGTRAGLFRTVYRFKNEQLLEVVNRTAHAAALSALVDTGSAYRLYFAVYVRSSGRLTPLYMALIDPFRRLIVYPSLLRSLRTTWNQAFGNPARQ